MTRDGKVAIVTGATGGLGRSIVARLVRDGMHVVAAGRSADWHARSGSVYVAGDVTDETYVKSLVRQAVDRFGGLDVLVNSHGLDFYSEIPSRDIGDARPRNARRSGDRGEHHREARRHRRLNQPCSSVSSRILRVRGE